jgi:hypothetical protein
MLFKNLKELGERVITLGSGTLIPSGSYKAEYESISDILLLSISMILFGPTLVEKNSDSPSAQAREAPAIPPPTISTSVSWMFWLV